MASDDVSEFGVEVPDKLFFRIGETASLVGVEPHVLRYWESEFRLKPKRSQSGQRMYRRQDIASFLRIRKLLHEEGFTIAGARKVLDGTATDGDVQVTTADPSRIKDALAKVQNIRQQVAELRENLNAVGVAAHARSH